MTPEEILAKYSRLNLDLHMTKAASQQKEPVTSKPSISGSQEPKTEVRELLENLVRKSVSVHRYSFHYLSRIGGFVYSHS